jgi:branched-chain amino acid transport system substrate-binding protein
MTNRLQKTLLGSCLALGLGLTTQTSAEELRIGYISPVTGIFAQVGKDMVDGFQMYLDEHGGKLGGMDVKFIVEDDQGKPDTGVTKAKKLILQDKVHMFIGGLLASTGYALARKPSTFRQCHRPMT